MMIKIVNGIAQEMTEEEIVARNNALLRNETRYSVIDRTRPLSAEEVNRMFLAQNINTIIADDATASRAVAFHPMLKQDGALISAGTRINWHGQLKRAAVDLWDTAENTPDDAPELWEDINYRDGFRVIPDVITAGTAFSAGEYGWLGKTLYRSRIDGNVWTPIASPSGWETVEL